MAPHMPQECYWPQFPRVGYLTFIACKIKIIATSCDVSFFSFRLLYLRISVFIALFSV